MLVCWFSVARVLLFILCGTNLIIYILWREPIIYIPWHESVVPFHPSLPPSLFLINIHPPNWTGNQQELGRVSEQNMVLFGKNN